MTPTPAFVLVLVIVIVLVIESNPSDAAVSHDLVAFSLLKSFLVAATSRTILFDYDYEHDYEHEHEREHERVRAEGFA